jgi:hypothetical protein
VVGGGWWVGVKPSVKPFASLKRLSLGAFV